MSRQYFMAVDQWEEAVGILRGGWYTRGELAEILVVSPRHASRIIEHMGAIGYQLEQSGDSWHLKSRP